MVDFRRGTRLALEGLKPWPAGARYGQEHLHGDIPVKVEVPAKVDAASRQRFDQRPWFGEAREPEPVAKVAFPSARRIFARGVRGPRIALRAGVRGNVLAIGLPIRGGRIEAAGRLVRLSGRPITRFINTRHAQHPAARSHRDLET
jgi:hypothetical protein